MSQIQNFRDFIFKDYQPLEIRGFRAHSESVTHMTAKVLPMKFRG